MAFKVSHARPQVNDDDYILVEVEGKVKKTLFFYVIIPKSMRKSGQFFTESGKREKIRVGKKEKERNMGGKGSGKRGTKYFFDDEVKKRPQITWQNKRLTQMDQYEIRCAVRYLVEGWKAALPPELLYPYCGLDEERIEELEKRDPQLSEFRIGAAERLVAQARVNVSKEIYAGNMKDSRWLLEQLDNLSPGSNQQVTIPVVDKQKLVQDEMAKLLENAQIVEFSNEGTESTTE